MTKDFNILVDKLKSFRNKYYSYRIAKGTIISLFLLITIYTIFSVAEFLVYLPSDVRAFLFYGFIFFGILLFVHFIFIPVLRLLNVLNPLNVKDTSNLIQDHFPKINDKLLNIIELGGISNNLYSVEIINASIDQKIKEISIFNFKDAVRYKDLRYIGIYFIISILISISIFLANSSVFTKSTYRIVHYKENFEKPAPYSFRIENNHFQVKKGESFKFILRCEGSELPEIVYINIEGNNYMMKNSLNGKYEYEISSVINPVSFYFTDLKYKSDEYYLELLPSPAIKGFTVDVYPPAYTELSDVTFENSGDLQVPAGSKVNWNFKGIDIDSLYISFSDSSETGSSKEGHIFKNENIIYKSCNYQVYIKNDITEPELTLSYSIDVIPDIYPEINVVVIHDSTKLTRYFFKGLIVDDYGFTDLDFHYNINNTDSSVNIPVVRNLKDQEFYFSFDFADIQSESGYITYYFTVTDNDVINNFKTTSSDSYTVKIPNENEILAEEKKRFQDIEDMINKSMELAGEIRNDINDLRIKSMDSNVSDWEKKQIVNDIISRQSQLEQLYDKIKSDNEMLNNFSNTYGEQRENIKEKQEQIEQLLDEIFTDELKKLLEEFNKLAEEFDSKSLNRLFNKMEMSYDDLQKQLDRNLEMLKKMKIEQQLQSLIDEIYKMSGEQNSYSEDISEKKNFEDIILNILDHEENLSGIQNQLRDILEINNELEKPFNFDDFSIEFKDIDNTIKESISFLKEKDRRKSGASMKNTSQKLENLAFSMQQMLDSNLIEQHAENIENLRQILSNLIFISFEQEDILENMRGINVKDPGLRQQSIRQKRIIDQTKVVKDSLYALAKRTPQITAMVNNELLAIDFNLGQVMDQISEGLFNNAMTSQQYVITSTNNLALMLNEALENLEEQLANAQPGDQQCEKPGGKPGMNLLKHASDNIRKQLEEMIEQLKGGNPDTDKYGELLMQHEMMQQMLRDIMNEGNIGNSARDAMQQIDRLLEQNRRELISKKINSQMISRQNLITTRLLEAEKAEMERDIDDKRERKLADDFYSYPVEFFEYIKEKDVIIENLNRNSHKLTNFYYKKYRDYINRFGNN